MSDTEVADRLDEYRIEHDTRSTCGACQCVGVLVVDLTQNTESEDGSGPWVCLECCQRIHETLTAVLDNPSDDMN